MNTIKIDNTLWQNTFLKYYNVKRTHCEYSNEYYYNKCMSAVNKWSTRNYLQYIEGLKRATYEYFNCSWFIEHNITLVSNLFYA